MTKPSLASPALPTELTDQSLISHASLGVLRSFLNDMEGRCPKSIIFEIWTA